MDQLGPIEIALADLADTRYLTFAAFALLLYDHLITIVDEATLIWPAKNGPIKLVFLFNRYTVPLAVASACMSSLWGAHMIADIILVARTLTTQIPLISYEPSLNVCANSNSPGNWIVWLNGILFNAIMISLLIWAWLSTPRNAQTPLMALIVRDGCIYFVVIFTAMLFNLLVWKYGRASQAVLPFFAVLSATTMALSRLLLSIKDVQGPEDWGQQAKINMPDMELSPIHERRPVRVVSRFSEDEDGEGGDTSEDAKKSTLVPKVTQLGRYDYV
ncbi:hypothetical protein RhiJN_09167 [Ceratobasidium sp. AG-Ba]|nr:hypothetical protein RhiJN_09167 [Ceratobasidium sp. AG-Ba]